MADVTINYPNGDEVRWQLPDPDPDGLAADVAAAIAGLAGDTPDVYTWQDRPST